MIFLRDPTLIHLGPPGDTVPDLWPDKKTLDIPISICYSCDAVDQVITAFLGITYLGLVPSDTLGPEYLYPFIPLSPALLYIHRASSFNTWSILESGTRWAKYARASGDS